MNRKILSLPVLFLCLVFAAAAQEHDDPTANPDRKMALVIGNSDYQSGPLLNPVNDARAMADALRQVGFEVMEYTNLENQADMKRAVRQFGAGIVNGGVGLFYYAGHGVQVDGRNFLIPTEAGIYAEQEVEYEAVDVGFVLAQMEIARNRMNIVILDACRNNPFARSWRSAAQGLAFIDAPAGTLIAYATSPGAVASDGTGANGLYTEELLRQIRRPGLKIEDVFKNVRANVMERSNPVQTPWETSSLVGDFYFIEPQASETAGHASLEQSAEAAADENVFVSPTLSADASWKASESGYYFYINDQDVSLETGNATFSNNLIVHHPGSGLTFLLENYYGLLDNKLRPARQIESPSGAFWCAGQEGFWLLLKARNVSSSTRSAWVDDDLLAYVPETCEYYLMPGYNSKLDLTLRAAEKVWSDNGTLWRASNGYWLYVDGENIAPRTYSNWSGNDLVVYDSTGKGSYLLRDYYNRNDNRLRPAAVLAGPGVMRWKREGNTYYVYRNNELISNDASSCLSGNDLLIHEKPSMQTILCPDWAGSDDGKLRDAEVLFSPTACFYRRDGDTYSFYREGQLIEYKLESKWRNNDLEVYDSTVDKTWVLPGYGSVTDNRFRPAFLKTTPEFR